MFFDYRYAFSKLCLGKFAYYMEVKVQF